MQTMHDFLGGSKIPNNWKSHNIKIFPKMFAAKNLLWSNMCCGGAGAAPAAWTRTCSSCSLSPSQRLSGGVWVRPWKPCISRLWTEGTYCSRGPVSALMKATTERIGRVWLLWDRADVALPPSAFRRTLLPGPPICRDHGGDRHCALNSCSLEMESRGFRRGWNSCSTPRVLLTFALCSDPWAALRWTVQKVDAQ